MVAYSFQARFAPAIESRAKCHTIRKNGKRRHARRGESVQLYTGMRTKSCRKLIDPDPVCEGAYPIVIEVGPKSIKSLLLKCSPLAGVYVHDLDEFARSDGFRDAADMHAFCLDFHGVGRFFGTLIEWKETA